MLNVVLDHHIDLHSVVAEPDHTTTGDSSKSGVLEGLNFEHDANVRRQIETLSVWQGEELVVVKHGIQVLDPLGVNISVEYDPMALSVLTTEVVDNLAQYTREETVGPFASSAVKSSIKLLL